jgi:uncharacterized glyoxalase superfamily protein PhnB
MGASPVTAEPAARLTGIAPQFLVADLGAAIAYYRDALGFVLDFTYEDFYASVSRDGFPIHLKHADEPAAERERRKREEHLDAYVAVSGAAALYAELEGRGARIVKPLQRQPWACLDFYIEDPDGHVLCFSELEDGP